MSPLWDEIKNQIRPVIPKNSYCLWIDPISCLESKDTIVLSCPNRFSKNWVQENYLGLIRDKFKEAGLSHVELLFKVERQKRASALSALPPDPDQLTLPTMATKQGPRNLWLKSQFTFDRFIVGQSNEFAYSASKSMASGDPYNYHSLLMLANTGLGKTHLSQAIGHRILEKNPSTRISYMTAEDFTNEMISSLRTNRIEEFKKRYRRRCDVLLLEEVHFLGGKEKIQAELGYTLDALAGDNKKIIFTSALPPKDIPRMSKELTSRLTSGLVTAIADPDYDTRVQILTEKASIYNVGLPEEVIHYLAERLKQDIRQMESALKCLKVRAELIGARIDMDLAKEVVSALVSGECSITTSEIIKLVCGYYHVDREKVCSKSRKKVYASPRNIYTYLCRHHSDETLAGIGKTINRSHSTVLYSVELIDHKMKTDRNLKHQVDFLSKRLGEMKK
jgi:chromosomal replication initiator protein